VKYELFDYQDVAASTITKQLAKAARDYADDNTERSAIVLAAPTGAGKTVIATSVIENALSNSDATEEAGPTFLWVTDDPSLNRQTQAKMLDSASDIQPSQLTIIDSDFDKEVFEPNQVYFLNIQKLGVKSTLSRSKVDDRTFSLWETIANTIDQRPDGFVVVVDEAHRGTATSTGRSRETIVNQIIGGGNTERPAAPVVWGISATPKRFRDAMGEQGRSVKNHNIAIADVRSSGLLKEQIIVGHTEGQDAAESALVRFAVDRIKAYDRKWNKYTRQTGEPAVHPILVIQVADKPSTNEIADILKTVLEEWPGIHAENIVHTFADHGILEAHQFRIPWCPPEDIQSRNDVRVVLCKTAITTGWDCPRAEVLLSFRAAKDIDFITQIMGRMVRTPLARRVDTDQDLNAVHCILPKFDSEAVSQIAERFQIGDDGNLAGGTEVIVNPVELGYNKQLFEPPTNPDARKYGSAADAPDDFWANPGEAESCVQGAANFAGNRDSADAGQPGYSHGANGSGFPRTRSNPSNLGNPTLADAAAEKFIEDSPQLDFEHLVEILSNLPSYTIPKRLNNRSNVERLTQLAILLQGLPPERPIDYQARAKAKMALMGVLDERIELWKENGTLDQRIENAGHARLLERTVAFANPGVSPVDTQSELVLDSRGVNILLKRADKVLPEGLRNDYINRLIDRGDNLRTAQLKVIALAEESDIFAELNKRAIELIVRWFREYGGAISRLAPPDQDRFDRIKRESDKPMLTTITMPTSKQSSENGTPWPRHILADTNGIYREKFPPWEEHVLNRELSHPELLVWYRNPSSSRSGLAIPYDTSAGISGCYPDFIFIEQVGSELRPSIIDPHGTHLQDAVDKLKGITDYAKEHGDEFHRIQSIAKIGDEYLMLNHKDPMTRVNIEVFDGNDASELFRSLGTRY